MDNSPKKNNEANKIMGYAEHFRVFSLYLGLDYTECQQAMVEYFRVRSGAGKPHNLDEKIAQWWDGQRKPQKNPLLELKAFFSKQAEGSGKEWKNEWLEKSLKELKDTPVAEAVEKFEQPYVMVRSFEACYRDSELLERTINKYGHKCFYIYRVHTKTKQLVRDVLRFQGHDGEKIFCTLYQFTTNNWAYLKWPNIKTFKGNVFFNTHVLDIALVWRAGEEKNLQYVNIVCPRFYDNIELVGILVALTDAGHHPAASAVLIQKTDIPHPIDVEKIQTHVRTIGSEELGEDYSRIIDLLKNKQFAIIEE